MTATFVESTPSEIRFFEDAQKIDVDHTDVDLDEAAVNEVAEIFETPLTGSFNWDYHINEDRIRKL